MAQKGFIHFSPKYKRWSFTNENLLFQLLIRRLTWKKGQKISLHMSAWSVKVKNVEFTLIKTKWRHVETLHLWELAAMTNVILKNHKKDLVVWAAKTKRKFIKSKRKKNWSHEIHCHPLSFWLSGNSHRKLRNLRWGLPRPCKQHWYTLVKTSKLRTDIITAAETARKAS